MPSSNNVELHRLVYYSRNLIAMDGIQPEIEQILKTSQRNNAAVGLTGALIFNSGIFAQVIEGDRKQIEKTFERIQRDDRHGAVLVLAFEPTDARRFPNWSMGHIGQAQKDVDLFGSIADKSGFDARRLGGERILEIMSAIAFDEEKRVA